MWTDRPSLATSTSPSKDVGTEVGRAVGDAATVGAAVGSAVAVEAIAVEPGELLQPATRAVRRTTDHPRVDCTARSCQTATGRVMPRITRPRQGLGASPSHGAHTGRRARSGHRPWIRAT